MEQDEPIDQLRFCACTAACYPFGCATEAVHGTCLGYHAIMMLDDTTPFFLSFGEMEHIRVDQDIQYS